MQPAIQEGILLTRQLLSFTKISNETKNAKQESERGYNMKHANKQLDLSELLKTLKLSLALNMDFDGARATLETMGFIQPGHFEAKPFKFIVNKIKKVIKKAEENAKQE